MWWILAEILMLARKKPNPLKKGKVERTKNPKKLWNMLIRVTFMVVQFNSLNSQVHHRMATLLPFSNSFTGMSLKFYHQGYPDAPGDLIVVSKTKRVFLNPVTHERTQSNEFSAVYFQFNFECIFAHDRCFAPQLIQIELDVKMCLEEVHIITLCSAGIMLGRFNRYWN